MTDEAEDGGLWCVKMRASREGRHVSGAERIVSEADAPSAAAALAARALSHPLARPDSVNVKLEPPGEIVRLDALRVSRVDAANPDEALSAAARLLAECGAADGKGAVAALLAAPRMRGAMILDADTLQRLDGAGERGVRATRMDAEGFSSAPSAKNHFAEALVLATKVANAPGMVAELCISDDPDYTTGYVASRKTGYVRIPNMKEPGLPRGGRVFLFRGTDDELARAQEFLERQSVLVSGVPSTPARRASFAEELAAVSSAGLYRECRIVRAASAADATIETTDGQERRVAVFSSNDYLDLAHDPRLAEAAAEAARTWGAGTGGSRLVTGTQPLHVALERRLAAFKGAEAAVLYATGYMANVGVLSAVAGKGDTILSDELNHASIIDGCRLSGAEIRVYRHCDMDDLERRMRGIPPGRRVVAVTDGVFSMDGDAVDLARFAAVCSAHGAVSVVDEAHATGVVGATGRGLSEAFGGVKPDIVVGTLSKALGSEGGFACCSADIARYLVNRSRPFIFSTAPCAASVAASLKALDVLEAEPERVERLRGNVRHFIAELARLGIEAKTDSAIVPIAVGDERRALAISAALLERGFLIPAIRYPTVARGAARLRVAISSAHTRAALSAAAAAIAEM